MMRRKYSNASGLKPNETIDVNVIDKADENNPRSSEKSIHYRKIQKLKKQGLSKDDVIRKLKLSYATVNANWDD